MTLRRCVTFLKIHGHPTAHKYPIGTLLIETRLAKEAVHGMLATEALLNHLAIASVESREGFQTFKDTIERLSDGKQ